MISLQDFIKQSYSPYHAVKLTLDILQKNGFKYIREVDQFPSEPFCYSRDALAVVAVIPGKDLSKGFNSVQSHVDSPVLKIVQKGFCKKQGSMLLVPCEPYSGPQLGRWLDRSLQIGGRVIYSENGKPVPKLFHSDIRGFIPSLAPHMLRGTDKKYWIPEGDGDFVMCLPFDEKTMKDNMDIDELIKVLARLDQNVTILSQNIDISVDQQELLGNNLLICSRLDNLGSVYCNMCAIIENAKQQQPEVTQILYAFNNEEVGSLTRAGAQGPSIIHLWKRIYKDADNDQFFGSLARSFVASCDGAHARHPVKGAQACQEPIPQLGQGFCIKQGQKQNYSFVDSCVAAAMQICLRHNIQVQQFIGKPYKQGGGTIGNFVAAQSDLNVLDCGVPMTGMHSCGECVDLNDCKVFTEFSKYVLLEGSSVLEEIKSLE